MKGKSTMSITLLVLVSVAIGIISTISYQKYLEWSRLYGTPYVVPQEVSTAAEQDMKNALKQVINKHALTHEQLAWLIFKNGFHGFFQPFFKKGAIVLGDGYNTVNNSDDNYINFGFGTDQTRKVIGKSSESQILLIDKKRQEIMGVFNISGTGELANIEFLIFTPDEIRQFSMGSVFGIKSKREPTQN